MPTTNQAELAVSVQRLHPYVQPADSGLVLNAPDDVLAEIPTEHLAELRTALSKVQLSADLAASEKDTATGATLEQSGTVTTAQVWRGPHGYFAQRWYGFDIGLDGYLSGKIQGNAIGAGMVASGVGTAAGSWQAGVIAAGFGYIYLMISACKHDDGWTYLHLIGVPPFGPGAVVCNPFG